MNYFKYLRNLVNKEIKYLSREGHLPSELDFSKIKISLVKDKSFGDLTSNAAMVLSKAAEKPPYDIAKMIGNRISKIPDISKVDIGGPGFINFSLNKNFWHSRLKEVLKAGMNYGDSDIGKGQKVNVEFVSANPTGPMHVGHGRGAVIGDALASLLTKTGYEVTREFYINDAGEQINVLAHSLFLRYREALGDEIGKIPNGFYPGEYLKDLGDFLAKEDGNKWIKLPEKIWLEKFRTHAVETMMKAIRKDLASLGIRHDVFTSEKKLNDTGIIQKVIEFLKDNDLTYIGVLDPPKGKIEPDWKERPQLLFRSTKFGDDFDRPLKKEDGSWTYFASDIAYHLDKFKRGFSLMIDIWGADHKGYIKRMVGAIDAVTKGKGKLRVKVCNLINLFENGSPVKMSKRSGTFVTLNEVIKEVGKDAVRFIMLTRNNEATLDFDLQRVKEQNKDNSVFYVQYAHARICSMLNKIREEFPTMKLDDLNLRKGQLNLLKERHEIAIIKELSGWPNVVENAALSREPHRIAFYLEELASNFHVVWNVGNNNQDFRFIIPGNIELTRARAALGRAVAIVLASGLSVIGIKAVEEMR